MPKLTIEGTGTVEVETGTRLVNAIRDAGVDIGHRCGGFGRCTTCRVEFLAGEPEKMTAAEREKRTQSDMPDGVRLACQLQVDADMHVKALMLVSEQGWPDAGGVPETQITPEPEWT